MKPQIKNLIITLIVLLIGVSVFLFLKNKDKSEVITPEINTEIKNTESSGEEIKEDTNKAVDAQIVKPFKELSEKFNAEMALGRAAMLKKDDATAIYHYNKALTYQKDSAAYVGLYTVYLNQKNWAQALENIDQAIKIAPVFGDYWNWKLLIMNEGLNKSYTELKSVYDVGYPQIRTEEKVNFVTYFARISSSKGYKAEAISLWQKAIELNPENKDMYQSEIDSLRN